MPRSRKRHHSRSRSRSRSISRDRSYRKNDSHEKDGKRRKIEPFDSPQKRSVSSEPQVDITNENVLLLEEKEKCMEVKDSIQDSQNENNKDVCAEDVKNISHNDIEESNTRNAEENLDNSVNISDSSIDNDIIEVPSDTKTEEDYEDKSKENMTSKEEDRSGSVENKSSPKLKGTEDEVIISHNDIEESNTENVKENLDDSINISDSSSDSDIIEVSSDTKAEEDYKDKSKKYIRTKEEDTSGSVENKSPPELKGTEDEGIVIKSTDEKLPSKKKLITPTKPLTPKQKSKLLESEKKRQEKEERERKKQEEKDRAREEKLKQKQQKEAEKQKLLEQKQKEREAKEEQKRKEKEEKELKRKEKEEKEEQKRKERELEKQKRQQEIDEKNLEKQREEEKKQKTAAAFVNFFVPKKSSDYVPEEKKVKTEKIQSYFMPFEIKSDMKLPPNRRTLTDEDKENLVKVIINQDENASYLTDLKSGFSVRKSGKTWPYIEPEDVEDDVTIIEEDSNLGETISEEVVKTTKIRAKYLHFHENRRPAYFGTWRKKSKDVTPRRPFAEDKRLLNYEEDSDDDWEEEEQGESLDVSDDEKENEDEKDDYEVDNEFFVPHGHLSEDEVDDEENARLSPESMKQKLKLLKDEFEEDIKSKTHRLKPRSIGCVWYNKNGDNVEEAIHKYLLPFAMITNGQIQIKKRSEISTSISNQSARKVRPLNEMSADYIPVFLKIVHGNVNNKRAIAEEFLTYMANNGYAIDMSKADVLRNLKHMAEYRKVKENGRYKSFWFVNDDVREKYNVTVDVSPNKKAD